MAISDLPEIVRLKSKATAILPSNTTKISVYSDDVMAQHTFRISLTPSRPSGSPTPFANDLWPRTTRSPSQPPSHPYYNLPPYTNQQRPPFEYEHSTQLIGSSTLPSPYDSPDNAPSGVEKALPSVETLLAPGEEHAPIQIGDDGQAPGNPGGGPRALIRQLNA